MAKNATKETSYRVLIGFNTANTRFEAGQVFSRDEISAGDLAALLENDPPAIEEVDTKEALL